MNQVEKLFLLSSPRSGSTLLANIIRAHPDVFLLNEILMHGEVLLPRFTAKYQVQNPSASVANSELISLFENDLRNLIKLKFTHGGNMLHRNRTLKCGLFLSLKILRSLQARLFPGVTWDMLHKIHHVNALHEPPWLPFWRTTFAKNRRVKYWLIKDVRPLKAYELARPLYPHAKMIYLIRHPFDVVASQFRQRGLRTPADLPFIDPSHPLENTWARELMELSDRQTVSRFFGKSLEHTFALSWRLQNEALWQKLRTEPEDQRLILTFEGLLEQLRHGNLERVFLFLGLAIHPQVKRYLRALRAYQKPQRHARSTFKNMEESHPTGAGLRETQRKRVREVVEGSELMSFWSKQENSTAANTSNPGRWRGRNTL